MDTRWQVNARQRYKQTIHITVWILSIYCGGNHHAYYHLWHFALRGTTQLCPVKLQANPSHQQNDDMPHEIILGIKEIR